MTIEMHMHDGALIDYRQSRIKSSYWPTLLPLGDELTLLVRTVAAGRSSMIRWSSRLLRRGIHVSPMSDTWLRMHEADDSKHGAEG